MHWVVSGNSRMHSFYTDLAIRMVLRSKGVSYSACSKDYTVFNGGFYTATWSSLQELPIFLAHVSALYCPILRCIPFVGFVGELP